MMLSFFSQLHQALRELRREMSLETSYLQSSNGDEDYIDMEISCYSPRTTGDFEFQMTCASIDEKETTPSPADELFYKGNLLPLHLPPRLQMVQKLLQTSKMAFENTQEEAFPKTPSFPTTNTSTPFAGSCNISPNESCRVSSELNPDEYSFDWSNDLTSFQHENPKKPWSKKLKLVKKSLLAQKLKVSRAYIKSLFTKSTTSSELDPESGSETNECFRKHLKSTKRSKGPYPTIAAVLAEEGAVTHRKSFSGAIKRRCTTKSSSSTSSSGSSSLSSSFSLNSNGFYELQFLKRSSSAASDIECSIEGAIEHCKQSQQVFSSSYNSKKSGEVGICSLSITNNAVFEDKER